MRRRSEQRGNILFLTAGAMSFLVGVSALVVDVAIALDARTRMQAAMDAAALAGAFHLVDQPFDAFAVKNAALDIAEENGFAIDPAAITFGTDPVQGRRSVTVRHEATVDTLFARMLGVPTFKVTAAAATTTAPLAEIPYFPAPFALPAELGPDGEWRVLSSPTPAEYRTMTTDPAEGGPTQLFLRVSEADSQGGNYLTLGIDGTNTSDLSKMIDTGIETRVEVGDRVQTRTGEVEGPINKAIEKRVQRGDVDIALLLIPRAEWEALQGPSKVTVIGYVSARLIGVQADGTIAAEFKESVFASKGRIGSQVGVGGYAPVLIEPEPEEG